MIFCGDTVFPNKYSEEVLKDTDKSFLDRPKIVNLESLIELEEMQKTTKGIALSSSKEVIQFLKEMNIAACSLANNHITDFDTSITRQIGFLKGHNIIAFGAGDNWDEAKKPFIYEENGMQFAVVSFGWDVIGCKYASGNSSGVNPMEYREIFSQVETIKREMPSVNIIAIFHNNYEFELYPQPAHRQMFFDLIEAGIKAIFCHHPHIVGGYELHKNCPIFYSLGNFYLPETNYNGYELKYPEVAKEGLCVEYDGNVENIQLYWTYKDENNVLKVTTIEQLEESEKLRALSPFVGMDHEEYIEWFKTNRKKKKLLPIYKNYTSGFECMMNNTLVKGRQVLIDFLVRMGVK